jgi:uncharacterized protein Yka (UPF0111/DUF47 family)
MKAAILDAIGETALQRFAAINAALAANDRIKYLLSLLQLAVSRAGHPDEPAASLKRERLAAGIADAWLDEAASEAHREGTRVHIPGAARILGMIGADLRTMAAPVLVPVRGSDAAEPLRARLEARLAALPAAEGDLVDGEAILAMASADRAGPDSLHLLVMDLHRRINALQAALAETRIDGAAVHALAEADVPLVRAFMRGLNRTAPLKFDHPGLATAATRVGERLVIQNDIGTTDAHVIVVHVTGRTVGVTYTDVHAERLRFLREMLAARGFAWDGAEAGHRAGGLSFEMAVGRFEAPDDAALAAALEFVGSRLVFLIDWNRARKALRGFLRGPDRIAVLRWASEHEVGHRGFLSLGGAALINRAIEVAAGSTIRFGDRLCDVLGDAPARDFACFVLRAATEGLRAGQSAGLINDRIRTELHAHVSNEGRRLIERLLDHGALVFEIATLLREGMREPSPAVAGAIARRARDFEHDADQILADIHEAVQRRAEQRPLLGLAQAADDAADALEEAAFLLELLAGTADPASGTAGSAPAGSPAGSPAGAPAGTLAVLGGLADLITDETQEWIKTLGNAAAIASPTRGVRLAREDGQDFLAAVGRVLALEQQADDAQRALARAALQHAADFRQLHLCTAIGAAMEEAADSLKRAALAARDHVMGSLLGD